MSVGGLSAVKDANEEIQAIVDGVKQAAVQKLGRNVDMFKATQYRTQVVAGMNYFVKVKISCEEYIELRIYRSLQGEIELSAIKDGLKEDSDITYIE